MNRHSSKMFNCRNSQELGQGMVKAPLQYLRGEHSAKKWIDP